MPSPIKNFSLSFKFTLMLIGFILISLIFSSVLSYMNQMHLYKSQREENIQYIANYLESRIVADGPALTVTENFMKHFLRRLIPEKPLTLT
jgi:hypothetical protein